MRNAAENTAQEQGGRPFTAGKSGNPKGRPRGARNRTTLAAEKLLDGEAEGLTRKVIELAMSGDTTALRLCMERILPPRKSRTIHIQLPQITTSEDIQKALSAVLQAVGGGTITLDEAIGLSTVLETKRRAIETVALEQRIATLEGQQEVR